MEKVMFQILFIYLFIYFCISTRIIIAGTKTRTTIVDEIERFIIS